jgi:hypothetical protein
MSKKITSQKNNPFSFKSWSYSRTLGILSIFGLMLFAFIAGCKKDDFKGEIVGKCPVVVSTVPLDLAVDVNLNQVISATFNTEMNPATINSTTFIIKQGNVQINGIVAPTADAKVFTFTPTQPLDPFIKYTGTITTGAKDTLRTAMVKDYVWSFTTIPQVTLSAAPLLGGKTSGAGNFAQGSTVTVVATPNPGYVFTNWTANGTVASNSTSYTFTMAGNKALVANFAIVPVGMFAVNVSSSPVAGGITTGNGSYSAGSSVTVTATPNAGYTFKNFTENGTIVSNNASYNFTLVNNRTLVANFTPNVGGMFTVNVTSNPTLGGTTMGGGSYNPGSPVSITATPNVGYNFTNFTENGAIVSSNSPYNFTVNSNRTLVANFTSSAVALGPQPIDLGTAKDFVTLTKSGISTTGVTSINGNIGVSPAAATAITGFGLIMDTNGQSSHTPIVTGKVYASDYAAPTPAKMTTAVSDMETAFTKGNNLVTPAPIVGLYAGDISGRILPPGLYKWATGVLISNAGVTLTGGPNDVWVFQIAQDLTVNNNAQVRLLGGAQAKNVFWVVSGQATLGSNADFSGIILSKTLISLNTGAKVTGRLYAQTAVTLNASTVTQTP